MKHSVTFLLCYFAQWPQFRAAADFQYLCDGEYVVVKGGRY